MPCRERIGDQGSGQSEVATKLSKKYVNFVCLMSSIVLVEVLRKQVNDLSRQSEKKSIPRKSGWIQL
jgi:hypothetical protein